MKGRTTGWKLEGPADQSEKRAEWRPMSSHKVVEVQGLDKQELMARFRIHGQQELRHDTFPRKATHDVTRTANFVPRANGN